MTEKEMTDKIAEVVVPLLMEVQTEIEKTMAEVDAAAYERGKREAAVRLREAVEDDAWGDELAERYEEVGSYAAIRAYRSALRARAEATDGK